MRNWKFVLLLLAVAFAIMLVANTPPRLDYAPDATGNEELGLLLNEPVDTLVPGTEKRVVWYDGEQPTEWSVVALHGFSASRQETAPLAEMVATQLHANLFETRFTGHGLLQNGLVEVRAEDWLDDVAEALRAGELIGEKTIVISVSNGAALTLAMLDHPSMQSVEAMIFLSPNFAPADPKAMWVTRPGGPILLQLMAGDTRSWEAHNDLQQRYWTTTYPTKTLIQVIRVVDRAHRKIAAVATPALQIFYSPNDQVVSTKALLAAYKRIKAPRKELVPVLEAGAPTAHIIAGDIISPDNTLPIANKIVDFILRPTR